MGGSVCRQVCNRQNESGDAVDALADAPKSRGLQVPAPVVSPEECLLKMLEPTCSRQSTAASEHTWSNPEECDHSMPMSESTDAVSKGLEASFEPEEGSMPLFPIHELYFEQVCPMVEPPDAAAKSLPEQDAASVPLSDRSGMGEDLEEPPSELCVETPQETPAEAPEEESTRGNMAEEKGADAQSTGSVGALDGLDLGVAPGPTPTPAVQPTALNAKVEPAHGEKEGSNESGAQEETKEDLEELPSEFSVEAPQETTKEAFEEETTGGNTAQEKGAEVEHTSSWSLGGSPPHEDAKAKSAQGEEEGNNMSSAQKEKEEDIEGCKALAAQQETEEDEDPVAESSSLSAWVTSMGADTSAFGTAWAAGLTGLGLAEMTKVGKVIHAMKDAGYSDEKANTVCKALFCKQSEEEMKQAFEVFDESKTGAIAGAEFGKLLKLLGEDVPPEKVDDAFKEVDTNNSGKLEYEEFRAVVRFLNPNSAPETGSYSLFGTWWTQQDVQHDAKQEAKQEATEEEVKRDDSAGKK